MAFDAPPEEFESWSPATESATMGHSVLDRWLQQPIFKSAGELSASEEIRLKMAYIEASIDVNSALGIIPPEMLDMQAEVLENIRKLRILSGRVEGMEEAEGLVLAAVQHQPASDTKSRYSTLYENRIPNRDLQQHERLQEVRAVINDLLGYSLYIAARIKQHVGGVRSEIAELGHSMELYKAAISHIDTRERLDRITGDLLPSLEANLARMQSESWNVKDFPILE